MTTNNPSSGLLRDEHAQLLDITDRLRSLGLGDHLPLPQLVVCGDQSCGKSSVLESISGVKFPISDGLCTRFAIQLVLRRSSWEQTSVQIDPGKSSSEAQKQRFKEFNQANEGFGDLPKIIEQAKTVMGLDENGTFSDALLRIESSGPSQPHLTLVDLPGLIHRPDSSQTDRDVDTVRQLVEDYMAQDRTIILAVMSASNQAGLQKVLKMAKDKDPTGRRTMGIITKPDTLPHGSDMEKKYLRYARNEEESLGLGWHIVRNANYEECRDPTFDRLRVEQELFSNDPWKGLPTTSLGAEALVRRLSRFSFELTRSELPKVVSEIQSHISDCHDQLRRLGTSRLTVGEQRLYLLRIAETFQRVVLAGVDGQYCSNNYFKMPTRRLRAQFREITDAFAERIRGRGRKARPRQDHYQRYLHDINDQILKLSRGVELPTTFDPRLVRTLFTWQSESWETLATEYADKVFSTAKHFVEELLKDITEDSTYERMKEEIIEPVMSQKQAMLHNKVGELLTPYTRAYPFSTNPAFIEELKKVESFHNENPAKEDPDRAAAMHACQKLAWWEEAYYDTALNTFIDNMATLGMENCILADLHEVISPTKIGEMDDATLNRLASESAETVAMRDYINHNLDVFEKSLDICRKCGAVPTALARGGSVEQPGARTRTTLTQPSHHGLGDITNKPSNTNLATPKIQYTNVPKAEGDVQIRRGSSASIASNISAHGGDQSSTMATSARHSPHTSWSPAKSISSISSVNSSPQKVRRNRSDVEADVEEL